MWSLISNLCLWYHKINATIHSSCVYLIDGDDFYFWICEKIFTRKKVRSFWVQLFSFITNILSSITNIRSLLQRSYNRKAYVNQCRNTVFLTFFKIANPKLVVPRRQTSFISRGTTPDMLCGARGMPRRSPVTLEGLYSSRSDLFRAHCLADFQFSCEYPHLSPNHL